MWGDGGAGRALSRATAPARCPRRAAGHRDCLLSSAGAALGTRGVKAFKYDI